jgi:dTDP-glucose 4,6-dehydratase
MTRVLLTGAAGFVGSHVAEEIIRTTDWQIVALDRLTYAGCLAWLSHLPAKRLEFMCHDFRQAFVMPRDVRYVIHNGAESHVARSLADPRVFVESNVEGTLNVLEAARRAGVERFLYTSTDEVYGEADAVSFNERDALRPSNPYAATKAAGELLVRSYGRSYGLSVVVTRTSNLFGERQHPEKFIPRITRRILKRATVNLHADAAGEMCGRCWLHARNQASAVIFLLGNAAPGEIFNLAGHEASVLDVARSVAAILGLPLEYKVTNVAPGHDRCYRIDDAKLRGLGWRPPVDDFGKALGRTVRWFRGHPAWLEG